MKQPQLEATGVFIPLDVWQHEHLSWLEKCLLAEIHALGGHRGACGASNKYLATTMGMTPGSVAVAISTFRKHGLVKDVAGKAKRNLQTSWTSLVMAKGALAVAKDALVMAKPLIEGNKVGKKLDNGADAPRVESDHAKFVRLWTEGFLKRFGVPYRFNGGRDGKAVKELLKGDATADLVMELVHSAWAVTQSKGRDTFWCQKLVSIHALNAHWNEIQNEVLQSTRPARVITTSQPVNGF